VLACIASWNIEKMTKGYMALFLFLETGILGVFLSLDFFLFYVFFEVSLLPMYFLIGIWGGPRKEYAAIKFFLYTLVGSIGLLIVLIGTYLYSRSVSRPGPARRGHVRPGPLAQPGFQALSPVIPGGSRRNRQDVLRAADDRLPDQGAGRAVPHVAAGCARRSADADQHDPGRDPAEDGRLRHLPHRLSALPRGGQALWLLFAIVGVVSIIYGALCAMARPISRSWSRTARSRTWASSTLGAAMMTRRRQRRAVHDDRPRHHQRDDVLRRRRRLRTRPPPRARPLRRLATTMPVYTGFSTVGCFANLGLPGCAGSSAK
jgi:NADH-quinone oxidoreductase subunit M